MLRIKKGNSPDLIITIKESTGELVDNLSTTTEIIFAIKTNKTDADVDSKIIKKKTLAEITVDDPSTGKVKIPLSATDTDITAGSYYMALQLQYSSDINEINMEDEVEITQDVVRG